MDGYDFKTTKLIENSSLDLKWAIVRFDLAIQLVPLPYDPSLVNFSACTRLLLILICKNEKIIFQDDKLKHPFHF